MASADLGNCLDVAGRWKVDASGADHRLAEERRDPLGADDEDLRLQRLGAVSWHYRNATRGRSPPGSVGGDPPQAGSVSVDTVVAGLTGDQVNPIRLTAKREVTRATFAAVSIASPPPEPRKTRPRCQGAKAASRSANSIAGRFE